MYFKKWRFFNLDGFVYKRGYLRRRVLLTLSYIVGLYFMAVGWMLVVGY